MTRKSSPIKLDTGHLNFTRAMKKSSFSITALNRFSSRVKFMEISILQSEWFIVQVSSLQQTRISSIEIWPLQYTSYIPSFSPQESFKCSPTSTRVHHTTAQRTFFQYVRSEGERCHENAKTQTIVVRSKLGTEVAKLRQIGYMPLPKSSSLDYDTSLESA